MKKVFIHFGIGLVLLVSSAPAVAEHSSTVNLTIAPQPCGYYGCRPYQPYQPYPYYGYGGYNGYPYYGYPYYGGWNGGGWNRGYRKFSMFIGFGGGFGFGFMSARRFGF